MDAVVERLETSRTFLVTGGNSGLGFQCASVLAADRCNRVIIACRDAQRGESAARKLRAASDEIVMLPLDLASQASVHALVDTIRSRRLPPLAGIVCNAGGQSILDPVRTVDGFEETFAVNHLGHYLLARLLLPDLAAGARIVFVASGVHDPGERTGMPDARYVTADQASHDFELGAEAGRRRYTTSKLCNVYTAYEFARRLSASSDPRLRSISVEAFDPGLMPGTGLARTYSGPMRFIWNHVLPMARLFHPNINGSAKSGRRLAALATGALGSTTGKYFSRGRE